MDLAFFAAPAEGGDVEAGEVEDAVDDGRGDFVDGFGEAVKGGSGGADDTTGESQGFHITDMYKIIGGVSDYTDETPSFFQDDVGCAGDEVGRGAGGDAAEGAHRAGDDDHCVIFA